MEQRARRVSILPYFETGEVVRGFGRGSSEIGIPTANYPRSVVEQLPAELQSGVYFGWARVGAGPVHPMVMSIGWNPQFMNKERSMETHILHKYSEDFYGAQLSVCVAGYIREEKKFDSVDALKAAIQGDISIAKERLKDPAMAQLAQNLVQFHSAEQ